MATQTFMQQQQQQQQQQPELQALAPVQNQQGNGNGNVTNGNAVTVTVAVVTQASQAQQPGGQQTQTPNGNQTSSSPSHVTTVVRTVQLPPISQQQQQQSTVVSVVSQQQQQQQHSPSQQQQQPSQTQSPQSQPQQAVTQQTIVQSGQQTSQFIAVPVSDIESPVQDSVSLQNANQTVHSTYVQYVEGSPDPNIYAASNGQMSTYPVYCVSDTSTMYTSATAYYNTGNNTAVTYSQDIKPSISEAYIMFPDGIEGQQFGFEVQWLIDNYETAEGVSLPRSTLYNHYLRHCSEHKLDPVNAASFGKLIRSVFLGLRTRRLGTRGNSKYHYYGIRVKPTSPLNQINDDVGTMALRQQPANQGKRFKPSSTNKTEQGQDGTHNHGNQSHTSSSSSDSTSPQQQRNQQYLGDASGAIPHFGDIDLGPFTLSDEITLDDLEMFKHIYKEHCEAFLDAVINLQFSLVETLWQQFWRAAPTDIEFEEQISTAKLVALCRHEGVQKFIQRADYEFYQNLVEVLIPDVLRPIPGSLTQAIRNFAKNLEPWLTDSMTVIPDDVIKIKISAVSAFAQTLRRYTSLNHLAQAARAVLQNSSQISQMLADLNRVDFHNVQEQASWVCQCDDGMVRKLEQDFKLALQQQNSLDQWAMWLEGVVSQVLLPHEGKPDFAKAARQFLLKWSFYSSMVIRDLTLRSAASFGSFHLIRLLYDEYMFYLIEHRVAQATGETPIAVMGEFIGYGHKVSLRDISNNKPTGAGNTGGIISTSVTNGNHIGGANISTVTLMGSSGGQQQQQSSQQLQQQNINLVSAVTAAGQMVGATKIVNLGPIGSSGGGDGLMNKRLKAN